MPILKILVDVPVEIAKGLSDGRYTRDAAGIIRWAKGTDHAGEIVAHLREIGSDFQLTQPVPPNFLFPLSALMAVQLAGFAYLGLQLKKIGTAISKLQQDVNRIVSHVEIIREQQYLDRLNRVAHGMEHLADSEFRPALLEEAQKSFGKARAEIRLFLQHQSSVALVENLPQTELLLQGICVSFAGEHVCLHTQRAECSEIANACQRYATIVSDARQKLLEAPPIDRPPIQSSRYLANFSALRPLRERVTFIEEKILGEKQFVEALGKVDPTVLSQFSQQGLLETQRQVIVVYP